MGELTYRRGNEISYLHVAFGFVEVLPDRVTVRLSDAALQAREDALKANTKKKKGGDA